MTNIITACFGGTQYANTRPAWLIDHGMVLQIKDIELPETYFVDFANSKAEQATRVLGNADGVVIPDQYFLSNAPQIFAWVYLTTGESGFTTLQITIPLAQRPDVSTEPPTPQETDLIEQAIAALNNGVERAETAAETAEEAAEHYPRIVDGYWYAWVDGQWANTGVKAEGEDGASAYEQAVAGGYTKSEAQFNAELGSFGELSEQAADSAAAAAQSAEGAADSADTAYQKAGEAASSAQAASQSAQNAAASATAASQSERNAASSASAAADSEEHAAALVDSLPDDYEDLLQDTTKTMQAVEATTVGPVAITTFDASAADMPLKGLTVNIEPVQAEGTPTPENPLPITGWTGANVARTGKNLWKPFDSQTINGVTLTVDDDGGCSLTGTATANAIFVMPVTILSGSYYLSANNAEIIGTSVRLMLVSNTGGADKQIYLSVANAAAPITLDTEYNQLRIRVNAGVAFTSTKFYPQLELGSTGTAYEPFVANDIYPITFPSPDPGTVYGGTLDVTGGTLTNNYYYHLVNGAESGFKQEGNTNTFIACSIRFTSNGFPTCDYSLRSLTLSDKFSTSIPSGTNGRLVITQSSGDQFINFGFSKSYLVDSGFTADLNGIKDWFAANNTQIIYPIANPIEINLVPQQITTLLGTNNIWADAGDVTVTYGAYLETVKAYADKVGDSILSAIAPLETSYTASRAYTVGSFLFVGTKFYKVTAAIAEGGTITPDTNVTQTTVAEQLMALANA